MGIGGTLPTKTREMVRGGERSGKEQNNDGQGQDAPGRASNHGDDNGPGNGGNACWRTGSGQDGREADGRPSSLEWNAAQTRHMRKGGAGPAGDPGAPAEG